MAEQDYTPVDAGSLCQPVPSAGTGEAEPIDHRGFLHVTGNLPCHDGHLVDKPVLLLLLQGRDAELLHVHGDSVPLHLGSIRPGEG